MSRSSRDDSSVEDSLAEEKPFLRDHEDRPAQPKARRSMLWLHLVVLCGYTAILVGALIFLSRPNPIYREELGDSPIRDAFRYKKKLVHYNFEETNPYIGQTQQEVDDAWLAILNAPHEMGVSKAAMDKANVSSIQFNDGSYMVAPMAYHMLHCLYNLHRYAHIDFYGPDPSGDAWMMKHSDHCIDNLRQFVQCHAGSGLETWKWLPDRKIPWPVLSTEEVCIDWDHFHGWVQERSIPSEDMKSMRGGNLLTHPKLGAITEADLFPEHQHDHSSR